jgi:hypothetical protein
MVLCESVVLWEGFIIWEERENGEATKNEYIKGNKI